MGEGENSYAGNPEIQAEAKNIVGDLAPEDSAAVGESYSRTAADALKETQSNGKDS